MKKFVVLALALLSLAGTAFADAIDLKTLDTDALLELQASISQEISIRLAKAAPTIYTGTYEVGVSIEPGDYIIVLVSQREDYAGEILVFADKKAYNDSHTYLPTHEPTLYLDDVPINTPIHLSLAEGEILLIGHGNWVITKI